AALPAWADMAVHSGIQTGRWDLAAPSFGHDRYLGTQAILAYGDILAARGDLARLRAARAQFAAVTPALAAAIAKEPDADVDTPRWVKVVTLQGEGRSEERRVGR